MNYTKMMNKALTFVESNLRKDIGPSDVSAEVFYSLPHLYRVFRAMTGLSIKEYIRKRRLSLAAESLLTTKKKVIDLALEFCYESPETFLRAFQKTYGTPPLAFRKTAQEVELFHPMKISESWDSTVKLSPRFVFHKELGLVGRSLRTSLSEGRNLSEIPGFWEQLGREGFLASSSFQDFYGVYNEWDGEDDFSLFVGTSSENPGNCAIPASRYAVFTLEEFTAEKSAQLWTAIYGQWFPQTRLERTERLVDFERYSPGFQTMEVFIPMKN